MTDEWNNRRGTDADHPRSPNGPGEMSKLDSIVRRGQQGKPKLVLNQGGLWAFLLKNGLRKLIDEMPKTLVDSVVASSRTEREYALAQLAYGGIFERAGMGVEFERFFLHAPDWTLSYIGRARTIYANRLSTATRAIEFVLLVEPSTIDMTDMEIIDMLRDKYGVKASIPLVVKARERLREALKQTSQPKR